MSIMSRVISPDAGHNNADAGHNNADEVSLDL